MLQIIKKTTDWGYGPEYIFAKEGDIIQTRSEAEMRLIAAGLAVRYLGDTPPTALPRPARDVVVLLNQNIASEVSQCLTF